MAKLSEDEMLRLACIYAEQDREAWLQAHDNCRKDKSYKQKIKEIEQFLEQVKAYRLARWGRTTLERQLENSTMVDINPPKKE